MTALLFVILAAFLLNIPFGYFRRNERKYSWRWFLYIHMPIPLIVAARLLTNTEFKYVPLIVLAAFAGQYLGGRLGVNG
ncbi:MAG TPA: hypothetical protein VK445_06620 [Dissulfurispiraceae bacterium]|nr:hypothetical protein [Dissulfurispiraceae bacterium]